MICWFCEFVPELISNSAMNQSWKREESVDRLADEVREGKFDEEEAEWIQQEFNFDHS
jgi:hypothetical protein